MPTKARDSFHNTSRSCRGDNATIFLAHARTMGIGLVWNSSLHTYSQFFFFCVRCDDRAKSPGQLLLGSPPSAVVWQLAPRAWCPLQCLLAKTVGVLSPGVCRSEECAQEFAPQSHIHSVLNQQDLVSSDVFLVHSGQYADGR